MKEQNSLAHHLKIRPTDRFDDDDDPNTPNDWEDEYYFYHYDARGRATAIVQPNGSLVEGYTYDAFGNLTLTEDDGFLNDVTYTSSVTDTSTGLSVFHSWRQVIHTNP